MLLFGCGPWEASVAGPREVMPLTCIHEVPIRVFSGACLNLGKVGRVVHQCPMPNHLMASLYCCGLDGHRSRGCSS